MEEVKIQTWRRRHEDIGRGWNNVSSSQGMPRIVDNF
jgi:hypothetical protein